MPVTECNNCGCDYEWKWEEAFDKFGFGDGDGQIETWQVEDVLLDAGYQVKSGDWGMHNRVINSIKKDGIELIPDQDSEYDFGYTNPREYLPKEVIELLDREL